MEPTKDEILLTAADVARRLKIRTSTVYEATASGRLPCVRLWKGRRRSLIRFRPGDIERFVSDRTIGPEPAAPADPGPNR
jgi:excisionase family DNA binding protein